MLDEPLSEIERAGLRSLVARKARELGKPNPLVSASERSEPSLAVEALVTRLSTAPAGSTIRVYHPDTGRLSQEYGS